MQYAFGLDKVSYDSKSYLGVLFIRLQAPSDWMASSRYEWDVLGFPFLSEGLVQIRFTGMMELPPGTCGACNLRCYFWYLLITIFFFLHGKTPDMMKIPESFFRQDLFGGIMWLTCRLQIQCHGKNLGILTNILTKHKKNN